MVSTLTGRLRLVRCRPAERFARSGRRSVHFVRTRLSRSFRPKLTTSALAGPAIRSLRAARIASAGRSATLGCDREFDVSARDASGVGVRRLRRPSSCSPASGSERPGPARDRRGGSGSALPCTSAPIAETDQPGERVALRAAAHAAPRNLGRTRVISAARCVETRPSATPAQWRDVLQAPPISTPRTLSVPSAEYGARKSDCTVSPRADRRRDADGRRKLARHLGRKAWSR
jgi:hypothetical protein